MVDVAKQAFYTKNFSLAADIYERQIANNGPSIEMCLGLADSYARAYQFQRSFDAYIRAFRLGKIMPEKLDNLVIALVDAMANLSTDGACKTKRIDPFSCADCSSLWSEPVTLQCGHSYCRTCLQRLSDRKCKVCSHVTGYVKKLSQLKPNFLLSKVVDNWFKDQLKAVRLKNKGNEQFRKHKLNDAVKYYNEAISTSKENCYHFKCFSNFISNLNM